MPRPPGMLPDGAAGSDDPVAARRLGLAVDVAGGTVRLSLRERALARGITVAALELEVLDVSFPLELAGGAERFQSHATRLVRLELAIQLATLSRALSTAARQAGGPLSRIVLRADRGLLAVEATPRAPGAAIPIVASLAAAPDPTHGVRFVSAGELAFAPGEPPARSLSSALREVADVLLAALPGAGGAILIPPGTIALDPLAPVIWSLFPSSGWRLPRLDGIAVTGVRLAGERLEVVAGGLARAEEPRPEGADRALRVLARADAARSIAGAATARLASDAVTAFTALRARLDDRCGPEVLLDELLTLGVSEPRLHADAADLAADALAVAPEHVPALLARGLLSNDPGDLERAASILERRGEVRAAGFALLAAARRTPDRARRADLVEAAAARAPNDPAVLSDLVEAHAFRGRTSAAVSAARTLAHMVELDPEIRAGAHVRAGDLLLAVPRAAEPARAKREYERALELQPGRRDALEGLVRAVAERGDPRRAAAILEGLSVEAEASGDLPRAARMSVALGDLWRSTDRDAALRRYLHARDLDPGCLSALDRVAREGVATGLPEAYDAAVTLIAAAQSGLHTEGADLAAYHRIAARMCADHLGRPQEARAHIEAAERVGDLDIASDRRRGS